MQNARCHAGAKRSMMATAAWRSERRCLSSASAPAPPSLLGVWKISASSRSDGSKSALDATEAVPIPRRVRFTEPTTSGFSSSALGEDDDDDAKQDEARRQRLVIETGSVAIPYTNHCDGRWAVAEQMSAAGDSAELLVTFTIDRFVDDSAAKAVAVATDADDGRGLSGPLAALESRLRFEGLYDGERIAGTVLQLHPDPLVVGGDGPASSGARVEVADFLCTRLFTFWGTPKVAAAAGQEEEEGV